MALAPTRTNWIEEGMGLLLLSAVGWFIARGYQIYASPVSAAVQQTPVPQTAATQAYGTQYLWPGQWGGTVASGLSSSSTAPQLNGLTIPPLSSVTIPPISPAPSTGQVAQSVCACITGVGQ